MKNSCGLNTKIMENNSEIKQCTCLKRTREDGMTSCIETKQDWIKGYKNTKNGKIPVISTKLTSVDIIDGWKVRWGFNRMNFRVNPGIYVLGNPDELSPVFVTANYKLTFDIVRKEFFDVNAWLLVLDTKGVNVWCAAGKGTFGTEELISRINETRLSDLVSHKKLVLPQLGAVGVSAHEVAKKTGFRVIYGPVRIQDLNKYLENDCKKDIEMRTVGFTFKDRMTVAPIEIVHTLKYLWIVLVITSFFSLIQNKGALSLIVDFLPYLGASLIGTVMFPALLPYLPFRSFALKGFLLGFIYSVAIIVFNHVNFWEAVVYFLVIPSLISYISLNFTGASTFTSLTGTQKEVSIYLPVYGGLITLGIFIKLLIVLNILS